MAMPLKFQTYLSKSACLAVCILSTAVGCAHMMTAPSWNAVAHYSPTDGIAAAWDHAADLPSRTELTAGQLIIHADFPLAGQHRLVRDLEALRTDVSQELGLPISDEPVHVYLFEKPDRYQAFAASHFPAFPARRAFFVESDTKLSVFAHWQDRVAEDLRHETTHGYVHAVVPTLPLWLDEGIAEFFELPRVEQGLHREHIAHLSGRLLEGTWSPNIERLESLESAAELSQDHYAEAWCWVHWMLRTSPQHRSLLQDYLTDLRRNRKTAPLSVRFRQTDESLAESSSAVRVHLEKIASNADNR